MKTDAFAVLGEKPAPWLDLEALKTKFLALSAQLHPDKASDPDAKCEAESRFAELNRAYETLRNTRTRVLHYLELQGESDSSRVQDVPPAALEFFNEVAEQTRRADDFLKQKPAASSPMLKARFFEKALAATGEIQAVQARIAEKIRSIESDIEQRGGDASNAELRSAAAALGFLERWNAQLQQRLAALAF